MSGPTKLLFASVLIVILIVPCLANAQPPIPRAGKARLKISLNAYSFHKALTKDGMTLFDLLDFCAANDFDALDPTGYYFPGYPKPPDEKFLAEFKRRAHARGIDISGTGVRNNFAAPDRDKRAADTQHVKEWIEVAARMGAPVLRVFAGARPKNHPWDEAAGWIAAEVKECIPVAKKHGVIIGIQNHADMLSTADETLKLLKMVNEPEWFGVIVDTGAFVSDDPYKDIAAVAPYAVNWQIKTHLAAKKGKTDLKRVVQIARAAGYRGYLPIETLPVAGEEYDARVRVSAMIRELREAMRE